MARPYPRFLYSDPQNTKSKGPFVVHTIFPRCTIRIFFDKDEYNHANKTEQPIGKGIGAFWAENYSKSYGFHILDLIDTESSYEDIQRLISDLSPWLRNYLGEESADPLKKSLIEIGFAFSPFVNIEGTIKLPVNIKYYGDYFYYQDKTSLILTVEANGWALFDGRPQLNITYANGNTLTPAMAVALLMQFGNNVT